MIDNIKISDLNALDVFLGMPTSKTSTVSLARSLNVSEKTIIAILENADYENSNLGSRLLDKDQVKLVIRRLAKELKKQYSRQKKNYSFLSYYEKQDFEELDCLFRSLNKRLSTKNDIHSLINSSDNSTFFEYVEHISNIPKASYDKLNQLNFESLSDLNYHSIEEIEIEQIEEYLNRLVYTDIAYYGEWPLIIARSEDESDRPFILFKYLRRIKVKSGKQFCGFKSQSARFYICGHYYRYNDDDEHSTKKSVKEAFC